MLQVPSRKINEIEKLFLYTQEKIQFAIEVSNPDFIPIIIQNFKNYNLGFHLRLEGENFVWHDKPINIYSLPANIRNTREACNFIETIKYDFHDTFSTIAANDNIVAVSASHVACDGGFFKEVYNKLLINDQSYQIKPQTPLSATDFFQPRINKVTKQDIQHQHELLDSITSLDWSKNHKLLNNDLNKNKKCNYYIDESPLEDFNFHKLKINLTDLYNFSFALSIMSLNGRMNSNFGTNTCVDLRQFLGQNERQIANTQNTSIISVISDKITSKTTVSDVIRSLHQDLIRKLSDNSPFVVYRCFLENEFFTTKDCVLLPNLSNVGRFNVEGQFKGQIKDTWIQQQDISKNAEGECFMLAFSREKDGINTLVTRMQQSRSVVSDDDANVLFNSIMHVMKEVPIDVTVQEAYDELRSFQNQIKRKKI